MTFRTRILLACLAAAVLPIALLGAGARIAIRDRVTAQYHAQLDSATATARGGLDAYAALLDTRLRTLERLLLDDPGTRAALATDARPLLAEWAPDAMSATGLDYLLLLDERGTVLGSGHFPRDFGRETAGLAGRDAWLVDARRPDSELLAYARARPFTVGDRAFTVVAGIELDSTAIMRLAGGGAGLSARFQRSPVQRQDLTQHIEIPYVDAATGSRSSAYVVVAQSAAPLTSLLRTLDRWIIASLAAAIIAAFLISRILAARVNRPLEDLARRASRIELDRYDVALGTRRRDEVGTLSRLLDRMVQRLRAGAQQLRDAERRATVGDMARQVNHDIRNGLLPIRNVIGHLSEVAEESPAELVTIFRERAGTLQGGLGYLETLAASYARLAPRMDRQPCDVNALIRTMLDAIGDSRVVPRLTESVRPAMADPVALRRVLDNLVVNALESLPTGGGTVTLRAASRDGAVVVTVEDTGAGMTPDVVDRIFDDFYSTKERGSGLGLSIVRRLVADMGGRMTVASEPGRGSTFTVELPAA